MKTLKLLSFMSVFLIFTFSGCDLPCKTTEEERFYRDFLAWFSQDSSQFVYVIDEYTNAYFLNDDTFNYVLHPIKGENYDLSQEVIDDFIAKNSTPIPLPKDMDLGVTYFLLSQSEKDEMQKSQQDIGRLIEEKYSGSYGELLTLSRVGFDKERTHALIAFNHWFIGSGAGGYCVFEKEEGHWVWKACFRSWKLN